MTLTSKPRSSHPHELKWIKKAHKDNLFLTTFKTKLCCICIQQSQRGVLHWFRVFFWANSRQVNLPISSASVSVPTPPPKKPLIRTCPTNSGHCLSSSLSAVKCAPLNNVHMDKFLPHSWSSPCVAALAQVWVSALRCWAMPQSDRLPCLIWTDSKQLHGLLSSQVSLLFNWFKSHSLRHFLRLKMFSHAIIRTCSVYLTALTQTMLNWQLLL